jgi:hypothetical protein
MSRRAALPVDIGDDEPVSGRVYFIQDAASKRIKIGFSTGLGKRFADLKTGSPNDLSLVFHVRAGRPIERAIHAHLKSERIRGEWFRLSDKTTDVFDEIGYFLERFEDDSDDVRDHLLTLEEWKSILASPDYGKVDRP